MRAFAQPFLWTDAVLVSSLIRTAWVGNVVWFADGAEGFSDLSHPCSSFHNMSLAFLAWTAVRQFAQHKRSPKDILWCLLAGISVFGVNVIRLALIELYREYFDTIHDFVARPADISMKPISAISGDCRLLISEMIPQGWNRDSINMSGTERSLFFIFKGAVYTTPLPRSKVQS
jgi:hypothetical protein